MEDVAIVGVGQSNFSRKCGVSVRELAFEAFKEALTGLDITSKDIDTSVVCTSQYDKQRSPEAEVSDYLNLNPSPTFSIENACGASSTGLRVAWSFIKSGLYEIVAVIGLEKMSGQNSREVAEIMGRAYDVMWESPFGLTMPGGYAMHARAHMTKYGTTEEQLAKIRVKNSFYGAKNPKAAYKKPLSLEEILASNVIATPLKMLDCCANADGASCLIMARGDIAKKISRIPIWIMGLGAASDTSLSEREAYTGLRCAQVAAKTAYKMAGVGPKDIDVAEVHDCFTIAEMMAYEDLGFAKPGEGPALIDAKQTYADGKIPVNVDGGLLSKGHPVGATGGSQLRTIVMQLRGEAGESQVKNAEIGLTHNVGGVGHYCNVTILRR